MKMKRFAPNPTWIAHALVLLCTALPLNTQAGPGHDHGEEKAPTNTTVLPRFSTSSAQFEAVGIVQGHHLHVYIDQAKTNEPLETTSVELKINDKPLPLKQKGIGHFEAEWPENLEEGHLEVSLGIEANEYAEQLNSELELEHAHGEEVEAEAKPNDSHIGLYSLVGLLLIGALTLAFKTIQRKRKTS